MVSGKCVGDHALLYPGSGKNPRSTTGGKNEKEVYEKHFKAPEEDIVQISNIEASDLLEVLPGIQSYSGDNDDAFDDVLIVLVQPDEGHTIGDNGEHQNTGYGS